MKKEETEDVNKWLDDNISLHEWNTFKMCFHYSKYRNKQITKDKAYFVKLAREKDQQTEALKKEVEELKKKYTFSVDEYDKRCEEITQLKKQLKEREEENEKYAEEKALELIDSFLRNGEGLGDKGMLYKEIQYRRTQFTNQINK